MTQVGSLWRLHLFPNFSQQALAPLHARARGFFARSARFWRRDKMAQWMPLRSSVFSPFRQCCCATPSKVAAIGSCCCSPLRALLGLSTAFSKGLGRLVWSRQSGQPSPFDAGSWSAGQLGRSGEGTAPRQCMVLGALAVIGEDRDYAACDDIVMTACSCCRSPAGDQSRASSIHDHLGPNNCRRDGSGVVRSGQY
jgi:hypothetical protein